MMIGSSLPVFAVNRVLRHDDGAAPDGPAGLAPRPEPIGVMPEARARPGAG